jgi:hypothetical protein
MILQIFLDLIFFLDEELFCFGFSVRVFDFKELIYILLEGMITNKLRFFVIVERNKFVCNLHPSMKMLHKLSLKLKLSFLDNFQACI